MSALPKRPREAGDDSPAKKLKSDSTSANGAAAPPSLSGDALIAQRRAEIAAKMASFRAMQGGAAAAGGGGKITIPSSAPKLPSTLPTRPLPSAPTASGSTSAPAVPAIDPELAKRVAEAKRLVAASLASKAVKENPYMTMPAAAGGKKKTQVEAVQQGSGLKMAAHPLLLDTAPTAVVASKKDKYKPMQPKFASIKANARNNTPTPTPMPIVPVKEIKINPYTSGAASVAETSGFEGAPKERAGRGFKFNQKGKYVNLANQMRQEAQLEALKQRIAESARKAGLDSEFETLEKNIRREPPPDVEWWDAALLPNKSYSDLDLPEGLAGLNIRNESSPITIYVQHPIAIPAPWDKFTVGAKPLMLTKKEQKKLRKQRRQAEQQDKQDRVRMGLIPPDPPKIRLANLMKVLTSDAVQDPTKVEARVRREVAMRKKNHEKMNEERKLTDEQRREKLEAKKHSEEQKGLFGAAFKIKTLSDPSHRFKVRKNAEQYGLTGLCIFNPSFALVIVEGSAKAIKQYSRLMLVRIAWTEASRARGEDYYDDVTGAGDGDGNGDGTAGGVGGASVKGKEKAEEEEVVSLENNKCEKVWEGPLRERTFTAFKARSCPTDGSAKEVLGGKWASYWDAAKTFVGDEVV
ncbi:hypothetical protein BOTBODRAFT_164051 [Botryobasidium botryosum FD-172 SS1]|uniref:Uncharacterized protein n=1 Tax=Botryobasidium botryosum (strain FD-172 SS1) TaxID=930990 RepID=A0A067M3G7_BOTB1|nr:hypothetical protein BOTBODRAFT_164051 [Botryobasidium botryosum FD-172 SS1]